MEEQFTFFFEFFDLFFNLYIIWFGLNIIHKLDILMFSLFVDILKHFEDYPNI